MDDDDDMERLLQGELLAVPPDFTLRVMAQLPASPPPRSPARSRSRWTEPLQWLALGLSTAVGTGQLASLISCYWVVSTAL